MKKITLKDVVNKSNPRFLMVLKELLIGFQRRQLTVSKWALGGTIAIIYSILVDPDKFVRIYGIWSTKAVVVLLSISSVFGLMSVFLNTTLDIIEESATLKAAQEELKRSEKSPEQLSAEANAGSVRVSPLEEFGISVLKLLEEHAPMTKEIVYQFIFLGSALSVLVVIFLFYYTGKQVL